MTRTDNPLHRRPVSPHRQDDRPTDADAQVRLLAWSGWMGEVEREAIIDTWYAAAYQWRQGAQ